MLYSLTLCYFVIFCVCNFSIVQSLDNGLALTPPMGWNTWNQFACITDCKKDPRNCISEKLIKEMADALIESGMKAVGYEYINLDDCWLAKTRDAQGNLVPDPERFPSGMKSLSDYIHSLGLKFGIYEDVGPKTCGGYPGSEGYEKQDVATFLSWDVDYVKLDGCWFDVNDMKDKYTEWGKLILATGRPMVYSCSWPTYADLQNVTISFEYVASICNLWRDWIDIKAEWDTLMDIVDYQHQMKLHKYAGRGHWNDPDMLEVGIGKLTVDEEISHMSLWAIMAAPLIAGNDLRNMTSTTLNILTNPEVIEINQDEAGIQGIRIARDNSTNTEIWARLLQNGDVAVALLNRASTSQSITVKWSQIFREHADDPVVVRDLWKREIVGVFEDQFTAKVNSHGTVMLRVWKQ